MNRRPSVRIGMPHFSLIGVAAALACAAGPALAGSGSVAIDSFSFVTSGPSLSWLNPYQSFSANALSAGGLAGAQSDSFDEEAWGFAAVGANTSVAQAGISTFLPQTFWALVTTAASTGAAASLPNQATANGVQSGDFALSGAGFVTFTVGYTLEVSAPGGNPTNDYATAGLTFNASNGVTGLGGSGTDLLNSFGSQAGTASFSGMLNLTVALNAGQTGHYDLSGYAVSFSPVAAVPEPSQWLLMSGGVLGMGCYLRRRRRGAA